MKKKWVHIVAVVALAIFGILGLGCAAFLMEPSSGWQPPRPHAKLHIRNTSNNHYWYVIDTPLQDGHREHGTESWYNLAPGVVFTGATMYTTNETVIFFTVNTTGEARHSQSISRGGADFRSWSKKSIFATMEQLSNYETITVDIP